MKFLEIFDETKFFHAKQRTVTMNKKIQLYGQQRGMVVEIWI